MKTLASNLAPIAAHLSLRTMSCLLFLCSATYSAHADQLAVSDVVSSMPAQKIADSAGSLIADAFAEKAAIGGSGHTRKAAIGGTGRSAKAAIGGTGRASKSAIGGTGRSSKAAIGGTGRTTKAAIGGTGRASKSAIGGTGRSSKAAIGGTGRTTKAAIGGTGRASKSAIGGTGRSSKAAIGGTGRTAKAAIGGTGTGRAFKSAPEPLAPNAQGSDLPLLRGRVDSWNPAERVATVLGQRFVMPGTLEFGVGETVVVEGLVGEGDSLAVEYAWTDRESTYIDGSTEVVVTGRVTSIDIAIGELNIGNLTVDYTSTLSEGPLDIEVGSVVVASGIRPNSDGVLLAVKVSIKD